MKKLMTPQRFNAEILAHRAELNDLNKSVFVLPSSAMPEESDLIETDDAEAIKRMQTEMFEQSADYAPLIELIRGLR